MSRRIAVTNGILALLAVSMLASSGCVSNSPNVEPIPGQMEGSENPTLRDRWFLFQRMYPFDSVPYDARQRAWKQLQRRRRFDPQDQSSVWTAVGPSPTAPAFSRNGLYSGRVNSIAISPIDPELLLIGSAGGGIWRSTDGGDSFVPVTDDQANLAVGSIDFAVSDPSIVYAGMGDPYGGLLGTGVLKSNDSGLTWARVDNGSLPSPATVSSIRVDPTDPDRVYLAQFAELVNGGQASSGFYFSADGGVNWTRTIAGSPTDLVISPANPRVLYLCMGADDLGSAGKAPGLYQSVDAGLTWKLIRSVPFNLTLTVKAAVASDGKTIYVYSGGLIGSSLELRLMLSSDSGSTWHEEIPTGVDVGQVGYNSYIMVDPSNAQTVYIGSRDVFRSKDGGSTWTNLTNTFTLTNGSFAFSPNLGLTHSDQHGFAFGPAGSGDFYIANDGGIWSSTDDGASFNSLNRTLQLTQFYAIAVNPSDASSTYGGAQDNGIQRRIPGDFEWVELTTGDGGHCILDPLDSTVLFATVQYGTIFRYAGGGATFSRLIGSNTIFGESNSSPRIAFIAPFANDGVDSTLYFGTWRLFESTDLGDTWTAPAGMRDLTRGGTGPNGDVLTAIGVGPANPNVVYTGSAEGRAMVSQDGGKNWTDISGGLPNRFITSIVVDPKDSSSAYLAVSGFLSGHVFKTSNLGAKWFDVTGNLPDLPVDSILLDSKNQGSVYIGNDIGVFHSGYGGGFWEPFNTGLPPAIAHALVLHRSGLIQVGTFGRGAFQTQAVAADPPDFKILLSPSTATAARGGKVRVKAFIGRSGGFAGKVAIAFAPAGDAGVRVKPASIAPSFDGGAFKIKISSTAARGVRVVTFQATDDSGQVRTGTVQLTVQ